MCRESVETTMNYTQDLNRGGRGVRSILQELRNAQEFTQFVQAHPNLAVNLAVTFRMAQESYSRADCD